jgi:branched-chain amino acid transport system substrate-binding protein
MTAEAVRRHLSSACTLALLVTVAVGCGSSRRDTIRIGIYGDCYGPFAGLGITERAEAGADVSFIRRGAEANGPRPSDGVSRITVAGKRVELVLGCDLYRSRTSSLGIARRLVEQQGANILITPDDVPEDGVASLYSPRQPGVAFISTALDPAAHLGPNVFHIAPDNRQVQAGLGAYAFHTLGWRTADIVEEDDPQGYATSAGFIAEFCSLGGTIVGRQRGPATSIDWLRVVRQIPRTADGVVLMTGLASTKGFFARYGRFHSDVRRRVVMTGEAIALGDRPPAGVMVAGPPFSSTDSAWRSYVEAGRAAYPRYGAGFGEPIDLGNYDAVELALAALQRVHGDMSHGEKRFMAALTSIRLQSPAGVVRVDRHHQAVLSNFLSQVEYDPKGSIVLHTVRTVPNVESTFGGYFTPTSPRDSPTQPVCRRGHVPAWAR